MSTGPTTVSVGYNAPIEDMHFQLKAFDYKTVAALENFEDYDLETAVGIIAEAGEILNETWQPVNKMGDVVGVQFNPEDGSVTCPLDSKKPMMDTWSQGTCRWGTPLNSRGVARQLCWL